MKRILETVQANTGALDVFELMDLLHLPDHPQGGELLEIALGEGMIRFQPDGERLRISPFGLEVLQEISQ